MVEYSDLTIEQMFAWEKCTGEHGWEDTIDGSCYECSHMLSTIERLIKNVLERKKELLCELLYESLDAMTPLLHYHTNGKHHDRLVAVIDKIEVYME